jgi:hypothetical protein
MSDALVNWGPQGPQPISPLSFFDVRTYVAELVARNHGQVIIPEHYQWSRVSVSGDEALLSLIALDPTSGLKNLHLMIRYIDLVELLEPLLVDRVLDFAGEITAERIITRINELAGVVLLRANQFEFSDLAGIRGTETVTMTPTASNLLAVGTLSVRVRQVNTEVDPEVGYDTEAFTALSDARLDMCLMGSNEPLEVTTYDGDRMLYSDGSTLEILDGDTVEFKAGMLTNYWARILLPGYKATAEVAEATVNVILELDSLSSGQVTMHLDSTQPVAVLGNTSNIGMVSGVFVNDYVGFNFNHLPSDPDGPTSQYQQVCRIRIRLIKGS